MATTAVAVTVALAGGALWPGTAGAVPVGGADRPQVVSTAEPVGAVSFGDAQHGWRVGAGGLILATKDGGASWSRQTSPTVAPLADVDAISATDAWAVGSGGLLLRTIDGGATWTRIQVDTGKDLMGVDFVDADHGWIIEWYGAVLATADGGLTWTPQSTGTRPFAAISFLDANHGFVGGGLSNDRFIWRTDDGGRSWQQVLGLPAPSSSIRAIDFSDPQHGIAVGTNGFSFRTANGGTTWTETYTYENVDFTGVAALDATHALAVGIYQYAQSTPAIRMYATSDAGATWTKVPGAPLGDLADVARRPGGGLVAAASGATTYTSADGASWTAAVDEARSPSFLRSATASGDDVVAVGDEGSVRTSHDGGTTWHDVTIDPKANLTGVAAAGDELWAVGSVPDDQSATEQPVVLHSTDHGETWATIGTGLPASRRLNAVTFTDADHGWVAGSGANGFGAGFVAVTTDGGATWSVQTQTGAFPLTEVEAIGDHVWAMGTDAFARSVDGGATWVVQTSESDPAIPAPDLAGFDFVDAQHGFMGAFDRVLATSDGGATWTTLDNPYGATVRQVRFTDQLHGWATDWYSQLLETTDGGTSWVAEQVPFVHHNDPLTSLDLDGAGRLWATVGGTVAVAPTRRIATVTLAAGAPAGGARTVTATVAGPDFGTTQPAAVPATGSVTFTQGGAVVATVPLDDQGTAATSVAAGPTAAPVVATYSGDGTYGPAPSPAKAVADRPAWYPYPSASAFVVAINQQLRGVTLTSSQRATDAATITTPAAAAAYVAARLADPYSATTIGPVYRLYSGFFTRLPDSSGLGYWVGKVRAGRSLGWVAASFAGSNEFRRRYGTLSDAAYVDLVYRNVLGRGPDASGRAHWLRKLAAGASRGSVMTSFSESSENIRKTAGAVTVETLAWAVGGRAATPVELTGGGNALGHGVDAAVLVRELLATAEIRPPAPS